MSNTYTTLYLRLDQSAPYTAATCSANWHEIEANYSGTNSKALLTTAKGGTQDDAAHNCTGVLGAENYYYCNALFISPLLIAQSIASGSYTPLFAGYDLLTSGNYSTWSWGGAAALFQMRAGAKIATIFDVSNIGSTGRSAQTEYTCDGTVTGAAFTALVGDYLQLEVGLQIAVTGGGTGGLVGLEEHSLGNLGAGGTSLFTTAHIETGGLTAITGDNVATTDALSTLGIPAMTMITEGSALLVGGSTLTAHGGVTRRGIEADSAVVYFTAKAGILRSASALLICVASLPATAKVTHRGSAALVAVSSLHPLAIRTTRAKAALVCSASIVANGTKATYAAIAFLPAASFVTANPKVSYKAACTLVTNSLIAGSGAKLAICHLLCVSYTPATGYVQLPTIMRGGTALLVCNASVIHAKAICKYAAKATLVSNSNIAWSGVGGFTGGGQARLVCNSYFVYQSYALLQGIPSVVYHHAGALFLEVAAETGGYFGVIHTGVANLVSSSVLYAAGYRQKQGSVLLVCNSILTGKGVVTHRGSVSIVANAFLTVPSANRIAGTSALLISRSFLAGTGAVTHRARAMLVCYSYFSANGIQGILRGSSVLLLCVSNLVGTASVQHNAAANLVATSYAVSSVGVLHNAAAYLFCVSYLNLGTGVGNIYSGSAYLICDSEIVCYAYAALSSTFESQVYELNLFDDWRFPIQPGTPYVSPTVPASPYVDSSILLSVMNTIQNAGYECGLSLERAFPKQTWQASEQYVLVIPGSTRPMEGMVEGMGRYGSGMDMTFSINLFQRYAVDQAYTDTVWITKMRAFQITILNLLQIFFPTDQNGVVLTFEPIRVRSNTAQLKYSKSGEWGWISIPWEVRYVRPTLLTDFTPSGVLGTDVMNCIQNQLLNEQIQNVVLYSLTEKPELLSAAPYWVTLRADRATTQENQVTGAGRYLSGYRDQIVVQLYSRNRLDMGFWSTSQLTSVSLGLLTLSQAVFDSLQLFLPLDVMGNVLCEEPLRLLNQTQPEIYRENREWCTLQQYYDVFYSLGEAGISATSEVGI